MNRVIGPPLLFLFTLVAAASAHAQTTIRCESDRYRYRYCRITTYNRVGLLRELSDAQCLEGRTWGYDYRGIWVDRGCRAEFSVGTRRDYDDRYGGTGGAVGGILGSILGGSGSYSGYDTPPRGGAPSWAVGTFRGYDPVLESTTEMVIYPSGAVTIFARGRRVSGQLQGRRIRMESGSTYSIERERDGFLMRGQENRREVRFYRVR